MSKEDQRPKKGFLLPARCHLRPHTSLPTRQLSITAQLTVDASDLAARNLQPGAIKTWTLTQGHLKVGCMSNYRPEG